MSARIFVPDARFEKAPPLPTERPPTRRETWEHFHSVYFDFKGHKATALCTEKCNHRNPGELETFCRDAWAWWWMERFMFKGWDKQPDWTEGDPVIPAAVPPSDPMPFQSGAWGQNVRLVRDLLETATRLKKEGA